MRAGFSRSGPASVATLWNVLSVEEGVVVTGDPMAVTAVCYFPPFFVKDPGELEDELAGFVRSLFSLPTDSIVSVYLVKQFKDYALSGVTGSKHPVMNF